MVIVWRCMCICVPVGGGGRRCHFIAHYGGPTSGVVHPEGPCLCPQQDPGKDIVVLLSCCKIVVAMAICHFLLLPQSHWGSSHCMGHQWDGWRARGIAEGHCRVLGQGHRADVWHRSVLTGEEPFGLAASSRAAVYGLVPYSVGEVGKSRSEDRGGRRVSCERNWR